MRLYWDQASLLKAIEVIGARGRNWPITDGENQIKHIKSSVGGVKDEEIRTTTRQMQDVAITSRSTSPSKRHIRDPHSSLSFERHEEPVRDPAYTSQASMRVSAKPAERDYHDLFASNAPPRAENGLKNGAGAKGGASAGRNYQPSRIFETPETELARPPSPKKGGDFNKYSHFEFGDGQDEPIRPAQPRTKTKHQSQWNFEDFSTPPKVTQKPQREHARSTTWDDDVVQDSPPKADPHAARPRRDADTHFELKDDGDLVDPNRGAAHPRAMGTANKNASLYENHVEEEDDAPYKQDKSTAHPTSLKDRHNDFDPHFNLQDDSPGLSEQSASDTNKPMGGNRARPVRPMNAQWEATDASPMTSSSANKRATNTKQPTSPIKPKVNPKEDESNGGGFWDNLSAGEKRVGYKPSGNGMGARKGGLSSWGFDDGPETPANGKENRGIKAGGDGMGGKKTAGGRGWGIGDLSDDEEQPRKVGNKGGVRSGNQRTEGDWGF